MNPWFLHIPHSSLFLPPDCLQDFGVPEDQVLEEAILLADHGTDEMFKSLGAESLVFPVNRVVCDPERFEDDSKESMSRVGMGVLYEKNHLGQRIRTLSPERREELLTRFYRPWHKRLLDMTQARLDRWGCALIFDIHSFSPVPLPHEPDQTSPRPQICLGTDKAHTPRFLTQVCKKAFEDQGFQVEIDQPWTGTMVPLPLYGDPRVQSILIEVRKDVYMDLASGAWRPDFPEVCQTLSEALKETVNLVWGRASGLS